MENGRYQHKMSAKTCENPTKSLRKVCKNPQKVLQNPCENPVICLRKASRKPVITPDKIPKITLQNLTKKTDKNLKNTAKF